MDGASSTGWFSGDGRFLHGYGRTYDNNLKLEEGLYEEGIWKQ